MTITPKKALILAAIGVALYFGYSMFRDKFASKSNEELLSLYGEGGTNQKLARLELELRVQNDKIKSGDLTGHVNDTNVDIAEMAFSLLGRLKFKEGIATYVAQVGKRDGKRWKVNAAAADALKATKCIKSKDAIPPLIGLLKWDVPSKDGVIGQDASEKMHAAAGAALEEITGENNANNASKWDVWWQGAQREFKVKE